MALLNILQFPDPNLKNVAEPIETIDDEIKTLAQDMLETMYETHGLGLAATQVNVHKRLFVMDITPEQNSPYIFVNPEIIHSEGSITSKEGCLSFPGIYASVKRSTKITLEYLTLDNKKETLEADDLFGICIQHEIDHLNGLTLYDHLSPLKQKMMKKKLEKIRKKML